MRSLSQLSPEPSESGETDTPMWALPAESTETFCSIVNGQRRIRIQIFEQAGDIPSEDVQHNRRVLDGELSVPDGLPAGSPIAVTLRVSGDGLLSVLAKDATGDAELALHAYVDGVVDTEQMAELARRLTGLTVVQ